MSGVAAGPGTWPGNAGPTRAASARKVAKGRAMSVLLVAIRGGRNLRRCRGAARQSVAERQVHHRNLLLLVDDELLGEPLQALVFAVPQLNERHVDGPLVVRDHHAGEVAVGVAAEGDVHRRVHSGDGVGDRCPKAIRADDRAIAARSERNRSHEGNGQKRTQRRRRAVPGSRSSLGRKRIFILRWHGVSKWRLAEQSSSPGTDIVDSTNAGSVKGIVGPRNHRAARRRDPRGPRGAPCRVSLPNGRHRAGGSTRQADVLALLPLKRYGIGAVTEAAHQVEPRGTRTHLRSRQHRWTGLAPRSRSMAHHAARAGSGLHRRGARGGRRWASLPGATSRARPRSGPGGTRHGPRRNRAPRYPARPPARGRPLLPASPGAYRRVGGVPVDGLRLP